MNEELESLHKKLCELDDYIFDAELYHQVLRWFSKELKKSDSLLCLSPMLTNTIFNSLIIACFVNLSKLFDSNSKAINIDDLIHKLKDEAFVARMNSVAKHRLLGEDIKKYIDEYSKLESILQKVKNQRDKVYAHNDKNQNQVMQNNQLFVNDIDNLFEFANDISRFVRGHIFGDAVTRIIANSDELNGMLQYVKLGYDVHNEGCDCHE